MKIRHLAAALAIFAVANNAHADGIQEWHNWMKATGGSEYRPLEEHLDDVKSIKDFGAKCNGTTDDTAAFGRVNTAAATLNLTVLIPNGTCLVSTVAISHSVEYSGRGTIKQSVTTGHMISISGTSTAVTFRGITFDGNQAAQADNTSAATIYDTSVGAAGAPASLTIEGATFVNGRFADVYFDSDDNAATPEFLTVSNTKFIGGATSTEANGKRYVYGNGSLSVNVRGSLFDFSATAAPGTGRAGVVVGNGATTPASTASASIVDNEFRGTGNDIVNTLGSVDVYSTSSRITIVGNRVVSGYGRGLSVKSDSCNIAINANVITGLFGNNVDAQIALQQKSAVAPCSGTSISNNVAADSGQDGINIIGLGSGGNFSGALASGNQILRPARYGMKISNVDDFSVSGGYVLNPGADAIFGQSLTGTGQIVGLSAVLNGAANPVAKCVELAGSGSPSTAATLNVINDLCSVRGSNVATISIASPGVVTKTAHGLSVGNTVVLTTTGALPTGLVADTVYYVQSVPDANTFTLSATNGGAAINTTGTQSGTQGYVVQGTTGFYLQYFKGGIVSNNKLVDIPGDGVTVGNTTGAVVVSGNSANTKSGQSLKNAGTNTSLWASANDNSPDLTQAQRLLTVSANAVTAWLDTHFIDTSGGAQTLNTINGGVDGSVLTLKASSTANALTVATGAGNITLSQAMTLDTTGQALVLRKVGGAWQEVGRSTASWPSLKTTGTLTAQGGQIYGGRTATSTPVTVATSDFIVDIDIAGATAVNLPASPAAWRVYQVCDSRGVAGTNTITITPASGNISGAATATITTNYGCWRGHYNTTKTTWITDARAP